MTDPVNEGCLSAIITLGVPYLQQISEARMLTTEAASVEATGKASNHPLKTHFTVSKWALPSITGE